MSELVGPTLVIGLGNSIMGDDGLGLAALTRLERDWWCPPAVRLVDGGTWGLRLLPLFDEAESVLLLDAIDAGRAAGALIVVGRDDLPRVLGHKLSSHQVDVPEILALAELRGTVPRRLVAMGLQPGRVALSTDLSPEVADQMDSLVTAAVSQLVAWGHEVVPAPGGALPLEPAALR
ncbi:MAG TPA: HyaD/HybD family hydrogenase maturation endopeptidase [Gemmatimonadales bacterium]|jgi:hydrogenase maturation protease